MNCKNVVYPLAQLFTQSPESPLLVCDNITYRVQDFYNFLCWIKQCFSEHSICLNSHIGIALPPSFGATASIYSVLMLGHAYVPLNLKLPGYRLKFIIDHANIFIVIGQGKKPEWCDKNVVWIAIEMFSISKHYYLTKINIKTHNENRAALLYTSGTTGTPKAIVLSHEAIEVFAKWGAEEFLQHQQPRVASIAPLYFDLSLFDLFSSLHANTITFILPTELYLMPVKFTQWLENNKITALYTVPSVLSFWSKRGNIADADLRSLKVILFAGEVFPYSGLSKLVSQLNHVDYYNLFGPTESNVCCYWKIDRDIFPQINYVPLGTVVPHYEMQLSVQGSLCVNGKGLFSGYWSHGKVETAQIIDGWYDTGDSVSYNEYNLLQYHGRVDRMIKLYGHRIEPGEIESLVNLYEAVDESYALLIGSETDKSLALCIATNKNISKDEILKYLSAYLPVIMLPTKVKFLKKLPRLTNGKIDLVSLEAIFNKNCDSLTYN